MMFLLGIRDTSTAMTTGIEREIDWERTSPADATSSNYNFGDYIMDQLLLSGFECNIFL